jgi:hypothetical protein
VSYDDMGPIGEDKRWDDHYKFAEFLQSEYPQVYVPDPLFFFYLLPESLSLSVLTR